MIGAVILAAGRSRRMGTPKLLLPLRGRPVIDWVVTAVAASKVQHTVVVVGAPDEAIRAALTGRPVSFAVNRSSESEMLDSLRVGLRSLVPECTHTLVVLGDQPTIKASLIDGLLQAAESSGRGIAVPTHGRRRGHPTLIASRHYEELMRGFDAEGLRGLLRLHSDDIVEVESADASSLFDLDTPEDYERLRVRFGDG